MNSFHQRVATHVLLECGTLRKGESVTVMCDGDTAEIGRLFSECAEEIAGTSVSLYTLHELAMHGAEPPPVASEAMLHADLILGLTKMSMAHTKSRKAANDRGARYLSMPDYSWELLEDPAMMADYRAQAPVVSRISNLLTKGRSLWVGSKAGTDLTLEINGRNGNDCPGFVDQPGAFGSPPDIEANIAPLENESYGTVIVDGSIPCKNIGLLEAPVTLFIEAGRIVDMWGDEKTIKTLNVMFDDASEKSRILAECGIGLNKDARIKGNMLTDEGAFGSMHFGFGANGTIGGNNDLSFHLDVVFREASLKIDDVPILQDGRLVS